MDQTRLQDMLANGKLDQAAAELERARAEASAQGDAQKVALTANDLGVVYLLAGKSDEAERALREAQRAFIQIGDEAGQARAVGNLARLRERRGDLKEATALYLQAADLLHAAKLFEDEYATLRRLSRVYMRQGSWWQSVAMADRALSVKPNPGALDRIQQLFYRLPLRLMGMG